MPALTMLFLIVGILAEGAGVDALQLLLLLRTFVGAASQV
jgi:hypothetical protein